MQRTKISKNHNLFYKKLSEKLEILRNLLANLNKEPDRIHKAQRKWDFKNNKKQKIKDMRNKNK